MERKGQSTTGWHAEKHQTNPLLPRLKCRNAQHGKAFSDNVIDSVVPAGVDSTTAKRTFSADWILWSDYFGNKALSTRRIRNDKYSIKWLMFSCCRIIASVLLQFRCCPTEIRKIKRKRRNDFHPPLHPLRNRQTELRKLKVVIFLSVKVSLNLNLLWAHFLVLLRHYRAGHDQLVLLKNSDIAGKITSLNFCIMFGMSLVKAQNDKKC